MNLTCFLYNTIFIYIESHTHSPYGLVRFPIFLYYIYCNILYKPIVILLFWKYYIIFIYTI